MTNLHPSATAVNLEATLRDDAAVRGVVLSTARAFPQRDPQMYAEAFHADGVVVEPGSRARLSPVVHMERIASGPWAAGQQIVTNLVARIDGDTATVNSSFIDAVAQGPKQSDNAAAELTGGRFRDRLERRDGTWRITERTVEVDWTAVGDASALDLFRGSSVTTADVADQARKLNGRPTPRDTRELLDRQAITDAIMHCARGVDRLDAEVFDRYYVEDMKMSFGAHEMPGPAFAQVSRGDAPNRLATQHAVSNVVVVVEGDRAVAETLLLGVIAYRDGFGPAFIDANSSGLGGLMMSGCRYLDDWERGTDGWSVKRRVLVQEWTGRFDDSAVRELVTRADAVGRRDREDPSYARLLAPKPPADLRSLADRRQIEDVVVETCATADAHRYLLTTFVTVDGDAAAAEVYCLTATRGDGSAATLRGSRELIDLERAGSGWRVTRATTIPEWETVAASAVPA